MTVIFTFSSAAVAISMKLKPAAPSPVIDEDVLVRVGQLGPDGHGDTRAQVAELEDTQGGPGSGETQVEGIEEAGVATVPHVDGGGSEDLGRRLHRGGGVDLVPLVALGGRLEDGHLLCLDLLVLLDHLARRRLHPQLLKPAQQGL